MSGEHGKEPRGLEASAEGRALGRDRTLEGKFGFMFKDLPPFQPSEDLLRGLAATMREPAGPPPPPATETDNPQVPAGFTFLGQFIDHDMTFDTTPLAEAQADPDALRNFRSARFDLDSVYGHERGPAERPELYDPNERDKLRITGLGDPAVPDDLPRQPNGVAIIGDPRNDENLVVCQLHIAFMKLHNVFVDRLRDEGGTAAGAVFEEARRLTRWHFQWVVIHDFLPRVVGQEMVDSILEERPGRPAKVKLKFYKPGNPNKPMMPLEYAVAAYRFGHSMIRPGYRINDTSGAIFFGETPTNANLNGSRPIPPNLVVQWSRFFDISGAEAPQRSRRMDSRLSGPLFSLPRSVVPPPDTVVSLAERNLLRGSRLALPSGQAVAREILPAGEAPLSNQQLGLNDLGWGGEAPLWFYVLKEAELRHNGEHLGTVGGRIVAEVILGLCEKDRNSYLRRDPSFRPAPGDFRMGDLLKLANVV